MKGRLLIIVLAAIAASCAPPPSYEPFVMREKAQYGDTYPFTLDLSDTTASYSLDFYTRLERQSFGEFPSDSLVLDLRWFSPSDSILTDTTFIRIGHPVDTSYYSRDYVSEYLDRFMPSEGGTWRLNAKVVNDSPCIRGLGIILKRL